MAVELDLEYLRRIDWWTRVDVRGSDECWPWKLSIGSHGYGQTWDGKHVTTAQRVAWCLANGSQIPGDLVVDHMCHNRPCCNPAHLQLLTLRDNAARNLQSLQSHCLRGHEFTPENTRVNRMGHRLCRTCARLHAGRSARPTAPSKTHRLTPSDARAIREAVAVGVRQADLARQYGVSPVTINNVVHGVTWRAA